MPDILKIGFIHAKNRDDFDTLDPLSFGYLKSYLDKYTQVPAEMSRVMDVSHAVGWDVMGISATSQDFARAIDIARHIKAQSPQTIVVLGGHHITYLPDTLPEEVDVGVMGEGEQTFCVLTELFSRTRSRPTIQELSQVNGIVYHTPAGPVVTPPRALITPMDMIPFPHREPGVKPHLFTSRGCPYRCSFCASSAFWKQVRMFSAEYVVVEIEHIMEQFPGIRHISIWDDLFVMNRYRLDRIVQLMEERGILGRVRFDAAVRAGLVDDTLCLTLKKMGVVSVGFGAESGSDRILETLGKGTTVEVNQQALDTLHRHGIQVGVSCIVGCPTETEQEAVSTYEFILNNVMAGKLSPHCAVNILSPMPGTAVWEDAVRAGVCDPKGMDWNRLSLFASYLNSNFGSVEEWIAHRQANDAVYLAEATLPQEQLYGIMRRYEPLIRGFRKPRKASLEIRKTSRKAILYYSDNRIDGTALNAACRRTLTDSKLPIISVTHRPIDMGTNIVVDKPSCGRSLIEQVIIGLASSNAEYIYLVEHDCLYHPSYFEIMTPAITYNTNHWRLCPAGYRKHKDTQPVLSACTGPRWLLLDAMKKKLADYKEQEEQCARQGIPMTPDKVRFMYEPGRGGGAAGKQLKCALTASRIPCLDVRHALNFTGRGYSRTWEYCKTLPYWGDAASLHRRLEGAG